MKDWRRCWLILLRWNALVHIWAMNFMLVAAAAVVGGVWGLIYRFRPDLLWTLIISHALWDVLVFLVWPI